ncbi:MAG TPA: acyl-CoA reductase [Candidatus Kryptonia bacterium]|nr:acyl-CoA reductase [Candidatus Kryptonia bacterium]
MPSAAEVQQITAELLVARDRSLLRRPIDEILARLSEAVEPWFAPNSPLRARAECELPEATGFSAAMIRHGLPLMLEPLRADAVGRLLDAELGDRHRLNGATGGPSLILHVLSGNLPALAAVPLVLSLAIKSAVLVKPSHAERVFPSLFIESLGIVDAELSQCAAALYWPGGRLDVETAAFAAANLVVASGNDATIADLARRVPGRFIGHGHRISFAVVAREALDEAEPVAQRLAYDVSLWDQQGCLSPQLVYVERGGAIGVERFAEILGQQLARLACELPTRRLAFDEQVAIQRFRQEAEWRAVRGEEVAVFASPGGVGWTVVYDSAPAFTPTPLNRTIWAKPIDALADLSALLAPPRSYLEAAGIAVPPSRCGELAGLLTNAGVHRVCRLGDMQRPDLTWRPGGGSRVAEWCESVAA